MIKKIIILIILFSQPVFADDKCVYQTEQIIENGKVVKIIEHKSCTETEKIGKKSFWSSFSSSPGYENTLIIVLMTLVENL